MQKPHVITGPANPHYKRAVYSLPGRIKRLKFFLRSALMRTVPHAACHLLSANPPILYAIEWTLSNPNSPTHFMLRALKNRSLDILVSMSWGFARQDLIDKLIRIDHVVRRRGDHRITFLASTEEELQMLAQSGLRHLFVNQNTFVDERLFLPTSKIPREYRPFDAVYDARISTFKRHELMADIERAALVTYIIDEAFSADYLGAIEPIVSRAHIFNGAVMGDDYRHLGPAEINDALNQCAVGLCLSAEEGAMYASTQYLLAGLPIVSTPSTGGRDVFFDSDYVEIVEPTREAVAAGVTRMRQCQVPPEEIRARTLDRIGAHRKRFVEHIDQILAERGATRSFETEWESVFFDKMWRQHTNPTDEILSSILKATP